jgi:predicted nucleic acid-binding protein
MRALLDTSIFMAQEAGRSVPQVPEESGISVVTVAELHMGVLLAKDAKTRARRLVTLGRAERGFESIPIDQEIARVFASIMSESRMKGHRPKTMDVWIAATAVRHGVALVTQDADFERMPQVQILI